MSLFDHGYPEDFILSVRNLQMTLVAMVTLETVAMVHFIHTLVHGEALRHFYLLSAYVENIDTYLNIDYLLKSLAWYFFPVNLL